MRYLKAISVGRSVVTMYATVCKFVFFAMVTIRIMQFDHQGTVCNDYSEKYRVSGA